MLISKNRILAVALRHLYLQIRDIMRLADVTYWPAIDMILWGFNSNWYIEMGANPNMILAILMCSLLWQITYRTNLELSTNLLEEIWERNVMNLFSTPLRFIEWVFGLMLVGLVRVLFVLVTCLLVNEYVFGVSLAQFGVMHFVAAIAALIFSGWSVGFFNASAVLLLGRRAQSMPWILGWLFAPFCGAFSDIEVLPEWMQKVSPYIPMTYIFRAARNKVKTGYFEYWDLVISVGIASIYLIVGYALFVRVFARCRERGLSTLE